jgi:hypothetical protein
VCCICLEPICKNDSTRSERPQIWEMRIYVVLVIFYMKFIILLWEIIKKYRKND